MEQQAVVFYNCHIYSVKEKVPKTDPSHHILNNIYLSNNDKKKQQE